MWVVGFTYQLLYPWRKTYPCILCVCGSVGCTTSLDIKKKNKISFPCMELNPDSLVVQLIALSV
jgi:hypothetical protein